MTVITASPALQYTVHYYIDYYYYITIITIIIIK